MSSYIEFKNVTKNIKWVIDIDALRGVSFNIGKG